MLNQKIELLFILKSALNFFKLFDDFDLLRAFKLAFAAFHTTVDYFFNLGKSRTHAAESHLCNGIVCRENVGNKHLVGTGLAVFAPRAGNHLNFILKYLLFLLLL